MILTSTVGNAAVSPADNHLNLMAMRRPRKGPGL